MVQVNDICLKDATGMWRVVVSLVTLSPSMSPSRAPLFLWDTCGMFKAVN